MHELDTSEAHASAVLDHHLAPETVGRRVVRTPNDDVPTQQGDFCSLVERRPAVLLKLAEVPLFERAI